MSPCACGRRPGGRELQGRVHGQPVRLPEVSLLPSLAAGGGAACLPHCEASNRAQRAPGQPRGWGGLAGQWEGEPPCADPAAGGGVMSPAQFPATPFVPFFFYQARSLIPLVALQGRGGGQWLRQRETQSVQPNPVALKAKCAAGSPRVPAQNAAA